MSLDIYKISFTEARVETVVGVPDPVGLVAKAERDAVKFSWDYIGLGITTGLYRYQVRFQVEADGYQAWINVPGNFYTYSLTAVEKAAHCVGVNTALVTCQLRITDGTNYSATTLTVSLAALRNDIESGDIGAVYNLRIFTTAAKNADELTDNGGKYLAVTALADRTSLATSADTTAVAGVAAATISAGAAAGTLANAKLTTDGVESGALTIENTVASQLKVDTRLPAAEKTTLETALGTTLTAWNAGDKILVSGVNENITANKVAIRAALDVTNVGDLTPTVQTSTGLVGLGYVAANLVSTTDILALINASVEVGKIVKGAIASVLCSTVETAGAAQVLDATGYNLVGVYSGTALTAANIRAAISDLGRSRQLDLGSIAAGSLDDIPETGVDFTVTANEKLGAGYAIVGLDATSRLITSVYDNVALAGVSAARIVAKIAGERNVYTHQESFASVAVATNFTLTNHTETAAYLQIEMIAFRMCGGDTTIRLQIYGQTAAGGSGTVRLQTYDSVMTPLDTGIGVPFIVGAYSEIECTVPVNVAFAEGDLIYVAVELIGTAPIVTSYRSWGISVLDA